MARNIEIDKNVTVGTLADKLSISATQLITTLMKNGVLVTVNEHIDFDTAEIMLQELGLSEEIQLVKKADTSANEAIHKREYSDKATPRPPVVAVMGHVDHGKTTLLDAMRGSKVASGEAGGITQHISASQVLHNGKAITFLDTPGHEAFSAIREHSARLTDLVVLVVAADDGVKPQTIEAIRFARRAGVKIIVAINKIDKEGANPNLVEGQLAENKVVPEGKIWRGDVPVVQLSAKTGEGVDGLLDMILLVSEVENLRADIDVPSESLVIESHMEKGRGPVAHALVQAGILRAGDHVVAGASYGKVRNLESSDGKNIDQAGPSTPVVVSGFKSIPEFGDLLQVVKSEKEARQLADKYRIEKSQSSDRLDMGSGELLRMITKKDKLTELNIVLKADVKGSLTTVIDSLKTLNNDEVAVSIVGSGVGNINENDVQLASASNAIVYGFNVDVATSVRNLINRDKVSVRLYKVIYELMDDVTSELTELLAPEIKETELGKLSVKAVFKTTKSDIICGGEVISGKLVMPALARIMRGKEQLAEAEVTNLKRGPQDVKEVFEGDMCGLSLKTGSRLDLQIGDEIQLFTRQSVKRSM